jgi:hypothetical protein
MCVLIFSKTLAEIFLILRRIQRDIIINICRYSCKLPITLASFNQTWIFREISEKYLNTKFHENSPVGAELFLTDRRIDR